MGCAASRLENDDTVRRCKERRRLIKEAVLSRHLLASAHSDYLRSLRLTGSALTRFARGEPLAVSEHSPPIILHHSAAAAPYVATTSLPAPTPYPPTPPHHFSPSTSLSSSPTIASSKLPHILSAHNSFRKHSPSPHDGGGTDSVKYPIFSTMNATYSTTPSQSSSAWDWENFYPPSPPDSEFFDRRKAELEEKNRQQQQHYYHPPPEQEEEEAEFSEMEAEGDREEVPCREWSEHCASTTSSSTRSDGELEAEEENDMQSRSDGIAARYQYNGFDSSRLAPSEIASSATAELKPLRRQRSEAGSSSAGWNLEREKTTSSSAAAAAELRMVVRHRDLAEIVAAIEEYFVKAAAAGAAVSDLLEIDRAQFHRSFRQLKSK